MLRLLRLRVSSCQNKTATTSHLRRPKSLRPQKKPWSLEATKKIYSFSLYAIAVILMKITLKPVITFSMQKLLLSSKSIHNDHNQNQIIIVVVVVVVAVVVIMINNNNN